MTERVMLIGIPSEPPLAMAAAALERIGTPHLLLNQREIATLQLCVAVQDGDVGGVLEAGGEAVELELFGGVYNRVMDHQLLPELAGLARGDPLLRHAERLHEALSVWCE